MPKRTRQCRYKVETNQALSPGCLRLLRLFQSVEYGRVENLSIRDGEPVEGPVTIIRSIRTDKDGTDQRKAAQGFSLKKQHVVFFRELAKVGTGVVRRIDVQNGLPLRMEVEETVDL